MTDMPRVFLDEVRDQPAERDGLAVELECSRAIETLPVSERFFEERTGLRHRIAPQTVELFRRVVVGRVPRPLGIVLPVDSVPWRPRFAPMQPTLEVVR